MKAPAHPFIEYGSRTRFLAIHPDDWLVVRRGLKTEYRTPHFITHLTPPQLVVGYKARAHDQEPETLLLVIESAHREPAGAITPESIEREGFRNIEQFRRYWMRRTGARFKPLHDVQVLRVHAFTEADVSTVGLQLILNLYGPWLDDGLRAAS